MQFLYTRYNVDLTAEGLDALKFGHVDPAVARKMDKADQTHIDLLLKIGEAAAAAQVDVKGQFGAFAPAPRAEASRRPPGACGRRARST